MALVLNYAARSDVGMVRLKNDDSAYVGRYLAVVADGMGGHAGGNVASASTVLDLVHLDSGTHDDEPLTVLADEIQAANSLLSELVTTSPQLSGMGTTVTALLLNENRFAFAHIGDSRAYRLKNGVFEQISIDHTFVQRLIDEGRLRPDEAEVHPHKNVLMRVLGDVDASPELDLATFEVEAGEKWLLCSDGLTAVLRDSDIEAVLRETRDLQRCVDILVELTLAGGSPDNVTVAVVEITEVPDDSVLPLESSSAARSALSAGSSLQAAVHERATDAGDARDLPAGTGDDDGLDDALGDQPIRADLIRQDLSSRPHILVGAASLATETGQIPIVTKRTAERRAARLLTHKAAPETDPAPDQDPPKQRRWLVPAILALITVLLAAVLWVGYTWTQTRYYVGASDNNVAIYNGVSQSLGPIRLSTVTERTDIPVDSLPEYQRNRVEGTIPAKDLLHAEQIVEDLRGTAQASACEPAPNTPAKAGAASTPTASASPSAAAKPAATPDDCGGQK
ncbi:MULTISPECIES: PP2C family serine/threonine-protein phosphatase [unclassified Arthrobacter]|uniref:PP2C family protein-serine/threonine phosphatase n=2 Tax=Arthrobacter TaxID=1663 RepID=UPI002F42A323